MSPCSSDSRSIIRFCKIKDLQIRVSNGKLLFLFQNQNIFCGYSKEPSQWDGSRFSNLRCGYSIELSQWDGSFEHTKHMLKLVGKKIQFYTQKFSCSKSVVNVLKFPTFFSFCSSIKCWLSWLEFTVRLTPLKNYKYIGSLSNTGQDPLKNHKATKPAFNVGSSSACQRNAI